MELRSLQLLEAAPILGCKMYVVSGQWLGCPTGGDALVWRF